MKEEKILLEKCVKIVLLYTLYTLPLSSHSLSIFSLSLCTAPLVCLQGQFVSICTSSSYRVCWANWSQFRALAGNLGGSGWQLATLSGIKIYGPPLEIPSFTTAVTTTLLLPPFSFFLSLFLLFCCCAFQQCKINKAEIGSISVCACSNKSRNP